MRIDFANEKDTNTTYSSIRCEELIGKMSDISEDERS